MSLKGNDPFPELRLYGAKIKVADMDEALNFYSGILGFIVHSKKHYPNSVVLENDGIALILSKSERPKYINYPNVEYTGITFQVNHLDATVNRLNAKGVEFLHTSPQKVGVGIANKFRDPFGNVHSLLEQQIVKTPSFEEPRIYNVGFLISDMKAAREFYCDKLGFVVRTEKYYPPALPLGHGDGTFAFMLHQRDGLSSAEINYQTDSQTVLIYETRNLEDTINRFKEMEIRLLSDKPMDSPEGKMIAFLNPAGLPMEIIERSEPQEDMSENEVADEPNMPPAKIEDMAWLAGHWLGEGLGGISEEMWTPPAAGEMLGMYRSTKDDQVVFYELLTIIEQNNSLVMRLKHFTPKFIGWENKDDFLVWPLRQINEFRANFGGLDIRRQNDELFMSLKLRNKDGKTWQEKFHFNLVRDMKD